MERQHIAILGAGAFGQALGQVLTENGHTIIFYDPIAANSVPTPDDLANPQAHTPPIITPDLPTALKDADFILLAAPSAAVSSLLPQLPKSTPLIIATKGLLGDELFQDFADYMVLSGPGFAADIKAHQETHLTATAPRIVQLFSRPYLSFDETHDRTGVLLCGSLKNVYAILAGKQNLQAGTPEHEKFLTEVAGEMQALLFGNNADPETVNLACGKGDLRLTCAPPSRNYEFGQELAKDPTAQPTQTVEGVSTLKDLLGKNFQVPTDAPKLQSLLELAQSW